MSKTNDASLTDESEILDVSAIDIDDIDVWLYVPLECQTESTVHDLYSWLKSEPELTLPVKRSIDTRTFTRPKKRSSRNCFESIFKSFSPSVSNAWKTSYSNFSNIDEDLSRFSDASMANREEAVPAMLKVAPATASSILSDETMATSGHESMEVFLNMSHSKGIDSFINLMEPGLSDPLMNVSQPSILYSSITSLPRDDCLHYADCHKEGEEEEPANLTHSLKSGGPKSLNINETFAKVDEPNNRSYCIDAADRTVINDTYLLDQIELNETYNAEAMSTTLVLSGSEKPKCSLSSTFVNRDYDKLETNDRDECALNATYLSTSQHAENALVLDTAYSTTNTKKPNKNVTTTITYEDKGQSSDLQTNTLYSVPKTSIGSSTPIADSRFSSLHNNTLDSAVKVPIALCNQSTPKNADMLNSTFKTNVKHLDETRIHSLGGNFKTPTSLRRELLAEIHRNSDHKLDYTFNHISNEHHNEKPRKEAVEEDQTFRIEVPVENKYNTYKKEPAVNKIKTQLEVQNEPGTCVQNSHDKKYYTFTKKSNHGGKTDMENAESLEIVDATFVKPMPKLQKKKQHIPRMLSKLPHFLQKSNPNLVSGSLKTVNMTGCANSNSLGYMKGSQPNIVRDVEKSLANKLYSLGKVKSGSEQRLLELNSGVGELQMMGAGGSTESIESTQSAHSAPDLDDRLSTCSDSSHNSYTVRPMNIEQLHQIVRMQEESLKQDVTPQLNRRTFETAWLDLKKDLPSPIMKNGIDSCESNSSSPLSMDCNVKTSSPILSPTRSSQSINTDGQPTENVLKQQNDTEIVKKVEVLNKPAMKVENKTKLRQPTNWNTGNRPSNMMSAIPRPPSRIPAPRFVRPTLKNPQGDTKRGYM